MATLQTIRFNFSKITTDEFALLGESFDVSQPAEVKVNLNFNFNKTEKIIAVQSKCTFHQQTKLFIVITVTCYFRIESSDWENIYSEENKTYSLALSPALHLASLTIGVARGVLHAKTENNILNTVVLPPINIKNILKEDILIVEGEFKNL